MLIRFHSSVYGVVYAIGSVYITACGINGGPTDMPMGV